VSIARSLKARYTGLTDPLRTERLVELCCVVLGAVLLVQAALLVAKALGSPDPEDIAPAPDSLQVGELHERGQVDASGSAELRARPLFWEGRRPELEVVVETAAPKPKAKALTGVKLHGVFGGGDTRGIIATVDGKQVRLLRGGEIKGWTLQKVERDKVILVSGKRRQEIGMQREYSGIDYRESSGAGKKSPTPAAARRSSPTRSGGLVMGGRPQARDK
jgi:hypothetical protein